MSFYTFTSNSDDRLIELFLSVCIDLKYVCLVDVAEAAGCHPTTIRNWRDGKVIAPRVNTLMNVADVLGYNIKWTRP